MGNDQSSPSAAPVTPAALLSFTRAQVATEACPERLLVILFNGVYDLTRFLDLHPGGSSVVLAYAGKDATGAFEAIGHSRQAHDWMKQLKIGDLVPEEHT
jgi:cytochrome b involved in lipid metabolism